MKEQSEMKNDTTCVADSEFVELNEYKKIAGWIEFFFVTLIFGTIGAFITIVTTILNRSNYEAGAYAITLTFDCTSFALNILLCWMLATANRNFVRVYTAIVVLNILIGALLAEDFASIIAASIVSIMWTVYFHTSKRAAIYFDYKVSRFRPKDKLKTPIDERQDVESTEVKRNAHLQKMIKATQDVKNGKGNSEETIPICLSSIVNYMVSPQRARENLSEEKYQQFLLIYQNYDADIYETPMTVEDYNKVSAHMIEKFKDVVPWEKVGAIAINEIQEYEYDSNLVTAQSQSDGKKANESKEKNSAKPMMRPILYCRKCGNKLPPDCNFCPKCGTRVEVVKEV